MNNKLMAASQHLAEVSSKDTKVSHLDRTYYVLVKHIGLSLEDIRNTPLPFLFALLNVWEEECKAQAKAYKGK